MKKPKIAVLAGRRLFQSFFNEELQSRLGRMADWCLRPKADAQRLADCDALITTWDSPRLESNLLTQAPRVRMISHCGGEVKRRFPVELFRELVITNTADPMARPTAELGAAFLLSSARNLFEYSALMRRRSNRVYAEVHEHGSAGTSLIGREVGLVGLGRIGRSLVELMQGFDIRWRICDPYMQQRRAAPEGCCFRDLENVLRESSLLVLAAAATAETANLLSAERLALLPDGATVINIARGSLVDFEALTREVLSGRLRCVLDVTDPAEPLPVSHPLRRHPGAVLTPHIGGGGTVVRRRMAAMALDSLERHLAGHEPLYRVTPEMLERMT